MLLHLGAINAKLGHSDNEKWQIMRQVYNTPIYEFKEFVREGYSYTKVSDKNNYYLFAMKDEDGMNAGFEIWKGIPKRQPDGTKVMSKPSSEQFGTYGWYICGTITNIRHTLNRIKEKGNPDLDTEFFIQGVAEHF